MEYKLLVYGLRTLHKYFKWGDKGNDKPRKMWLVKDVKETKNGLKVTIFRGYKITGTNEMVVVEEKPVFLNNYQTESIKQAVTERRLDYNFRFREIDDLLGWLSKNHLL